MSRFTVYNKNGEPKYEASGLEYHDVWMGEEYVTVNISSPTPIAIEIGDYLTYRGLTYTIYSLPTALKQARSGSYGDAFKYDSVKFSARSTELTEIRFFDIVLHDNNLHYTSLPTFSFYAETVDDFLDRIQANIDRDNAKPWFIISPSYDRTMQRYPLPISPDDPDYDAKVAHHNAAEELWESVFGETHTNNPTNAARDNEKTKVNISIDKQDIFNSLQHIKNSFGLNFTTRERTIVVGARGVVAAETFFKYGKDKGFYEIERTAEADQQVVTKLFAYGSDKNIPTRYYAEFGKKHYVNASNPIVPYFNGVIGGFSFVPDIINSPNNEYYTVKSSEERTDDQYVYHVIRIVTLECDGYTCRGYYEEETHGGGSSETRSYRINVTASKIDVHSDYFEPSYGKAKAFADAVQGKTRVNIIEGIDKKIWPSNHVSYDTSMPNQMAVNVLMLPGFPEESLANLCNVSYDAPTNKTTISIRKNTKSPYKPLMILDGDQQIGFSEDRLMPYITSPNMDTLGVKEGDIHFTEDNDDNGLKEVCPTVKGMTENDVFFNGSDAPLDVIVACDKIEDDGQYKTDDPDYEFPDFHITIPNLGFDLYEAAKESGELTISLTDGYCGGRDFKVEVKEGNIKKNDDGTWRLTVQRSPDDTLSLMFPYSDAASHGETPSADEPYQIRTGDHYVLSGIDIKETSYIWSASIEVLRKAITWLLNNDYTRFTYLPKIDEIYMARQNDEAIVSQGAIQSMHDLLKPGMLMWFKDKDLDFDGTIFIDTLTIKEDGNNGIPTYDVVLRNDKQVGTLQRVQNQVNSLTTYVNNGGGGLSSAQIKTLIKEYGIEYYLSKLVDDVAEGVIGFSKGLWVKAKGLFGIDEDGKARVSDLYANGDVHITGKLDVDGQATIDNIKSKNYSGDGIGDTGWSITNTNNGHSKLTIDELYVRMKAVFESLEVRERTYTGGDQIWSCAGNQIVRTDYLGNNESADHVPVTTQCRADGSPVSGGTEGEPIVTVPEVGDTYGYSTVKVPWLLRGAAMILGRNNGLVQGLFSRYSKVRFVIGDEEVSSNNRAATVSDISKIRRARCYFLAKDGDREVKNWWRINDLARCQTMNLDNVTRQTYISGEDTKAGNIFWWRKVIGVSYEPVQLDDGKWYHYFDVSFDYDLEASSPATIATSVMEGSDIPAAGDSVVQFGNTIIEGRMNLMMMEVNGSDAVGYSASTDAPCLKAYRGVYCFDLSKSWVGGQCCKMKLSPKSGYEFYGPSFRQVTEYDVVPVPVDRGLYLDILETRDDYSPHSDVRKCYYYDKVSHNGSYWLCSIVDGSHWVDGNGNYITDDAYAQLSDSSKAQCARKQNYTTEAPSDNSNDWTKLVAKGTNGTSAWIGTIDRNTYPIQCDASGTVTSQQSVTVNLSLLHGSEAQSFKISGIKRNSTTVDESRSLISSGIMFVIDNDTFSSLPSAAATAHSLGVIYYPTSTINGSDDIEITLTDADGGNQKMLHLIVNGIRPGANGTNGKDGWMITADPANVIITQALGNDTTQFSTVKVGFTAKKGNVAATISSLAIPTGQQALSAEFNAAIGTGDDAKKVVVSSPKTYTPQGGTAQYYTEGTFEVVVNVTDPDTNTTVSFNVVVPCYANLLGTWKQSVEAGEETIAANKIIYTLSASGNNIETIKADYTSKRSAVGQFETFKSNYESDGASINNINSRISTAEGNISTVRRSVSSFNILTGLSDGSGWTKDSFTPTTCMFYASEKIVSPLTRELPSGDYVISCYPNSDTVIKVKNAVGTVIASGFGTNISDDVFNDVTRYYLAFTLNSATAIKIEFSYLDEGQYYSQTVYRPQLEEGSFPSAFDGASAVTESQIKQEADNIELNVKNGLNEVGISILGDTNKVVAKAGTFEVHNSSGVKTFEIDNDGNLQGSGNAAFKGAIKNGEYTENQQTKYANELAIDGSGHLAKGNIQWNANGDTEFSGIIHASLLYSNTIDVDGGMYTIDPENSPANTFMVHSAIITLPSAEDYLGLELKFFEPHPTTRSIHVPTTLSPQSNEYIAKTYFDLVPLLEMVTQYEVPMGRFVTLKATNLWYNGVEYYCWMVVSGDDGGYSGTVQIGNKTMTYLNGMLMAVETV